jgi:hypothetical protein
MLDVILYEKREGVRFCWLERCLEIKARKDCKMTLTSRCKDTRIDVTLKISPVINNLDHLKQDIRET